MATRPTVCFQSPTGEQCTLCGVTLSEVAFGQGACPLPKVEIAYPDDLRALDEAEVAFWRTVSGISPLDRGR